MAYPLLFPRTRFASARYVLGLVCAAVLVSAASCQEFVVGDAEAGRTATVLWSGGVTDTSAVVTAGLPDAPRGAVRLAVTSGAGTPTWDRDVQIVEGETVPSDPRVHRFRLTDLSPRTVYHYALEVGGEIDTTRTGRLKTFAPSGFSYRVALGACAETGSSHRVFDTIRQTRPDLFLHLGDMHYEDIATARPEAFRAAFRRVHGSARQSALYRSTPIAYVWDDHDYGPNNSGRTAPGQDVAQEVYREYVPHYELAAGEGAQPIYQAFTVGRVRFLVTDLRSARTANDAPDSLKTMMGERQKAWFKDQLRQARDRYPVIAWVSSVPWIGDDEDAADRWSGFARERRELATYVDSIGVADQLVILSGDAHMVALDDGRNNHFGARGEAGGGFPVVHAAALDRRGSVKGGPYSHGPYPNRVSLFGNNDGQFMLMDVQDDGQGEVCITWTGKRYRYDSKRLTTLLQWEKCFPPVPSRERDARSAPDVTPRTPQ